MKFRISSAFLSALFMLTTHIVMLPASVFAQGEEVLSFLADIEYSLDARLGVTIDVVDSSSKWEYRSDERFPMSSTFKTIACAALLSRSDAGLENMNRKVSITEQDLVTYSPITETKLGSQTMTLAELCEATITMSDNTAGNLVLDAIGGPQALTEYVRALGDEYTQLNRRETALNEAAPGDLRDTTTPNAMANLLEQLIFGDVLSASSRDRLASWLKGNAVGDDLLRAGIPEAWEIGDKTGAGGYGSRSIAAVMWPPAQNPIIATIYITETDATFAERNEAIAKIGEEIARMIMK